MSEERKPLWPWIAALLVGLPVLYVASFGPVCWLLTFFEKDPGKIGESLFLVGLRAVVVVAVVGSVVLFILLRKSPQKPTAGFWMALSLIPLSLAMWLAGIVAALCENPFSIFVICGIVSPLVAIVGAIWLLVLLVRRLLR